jgi:hypothetical protein
MLVQVVRIASAILLLAIGGIHLALVLTGTGGVLGLLFILNAVAGTALAAGMLLLRGRLLAYSSVLGLLFSLASLLALLLALTVGLFGITERWTTALVPETVLVDAVAAIALAIAVKVDAVRGRARSKAVPPEVEPTTGRPSPRQRS